MSSHQIRAVDEDGDEYGPWYDLDERPSFFSGSGEVIHIRPTPKPRGPGWYQVRGSNTRHPINYYTVDPGENHRKVRAYEIQDNGNPGIDL